MTKQKTADVKWRDTERVSDPGRAPKEGRMGVLTTFRRAQRVIGWY